VLTIGVLSIAFSQNDWFQQDPGSKPSARYRFAMCYIGNNDVLLFGGYDGDSTRSDTWKYNVNSRTWTKLNPASNPPTRVQHNMGYAGDDQVVLFGGRTQEKGSTYLDDTWIFDLSDNSWTRKTPASKPSKRRNHGMDNISGDQVFLFGGQDEDSIRSDTWIYDLSANTWTNKNPAAHPKPRVIDDGVSYLGNDQILLYGGEASGGTNPTDTWVYTLSTNSWINKDPASNPGVRVGHTMAYAGNQQVIMHAGNNTKYYDLASNSWNNEDNGPSSRIQMMMAVSSHNSTSWLVLFGGKASGEPASYFDETWLFGSGNFSQLPVVLISFSAQQINVSSIKLTWRTASEVDNCGFFVLRSSSKETLFNTITSLIPGNGTTQAGNDYSFIDRSLPAYGTYYYRLQDVDYSGRQTDLDTIKVEFRPAVKKEAGITRGYSLNIYPNPFNPHTTIHYRE